MTPIPDVMIALLMVPVVAGMGVAWAVLQSQQQKVRLLWIRGGRCRNCGYRMQYLPHFRCPECGTEDAEAWRAAHS